MSRSLCGAKTRAGGTCRRTAMPNGRCDLHGGKSPPPGPAHPAYKHGGRSRRYALQGALDARYARHLEDLDYLALREEIALVSTRIELLASRPNQGGVAEQSIWDLIDLRRKLTETEARRIKLSQDTLTGEQIRAFGTAVLEAVRLEVPDRNTLVRIQNRTMTLLTSVGAIAVDSQ